MTLAHEGEEVVADDLMRTDGDRCGCAIRT